MPPMSERSRGGRALSLPVQPFAGADRDCLRGPWRREERGEDKQDGKKTPDVFEPSLQLGSRLTLRTLVCLGSGQIDACQKGPQL